MSTTLADRWPSYAGSVHRCADLAEHRLTEGEGAGREPCIHLGRCSRPADRPGHAGDLQHPGDREGGHRGTDSRGDLREVEVQAGDRLAAQPAEPLRISRRQPSLAGGCRQETRRLR
jgi:hypothetical protein